MPSENKQLTKRAKREAKRKALKQQNAAKKVETNKARKLVMGRREAIIKLRDDIFDFIVKKNSFKKFLKDMIDGANALKATNDAKYDGIIVTAYEKGLAKINELVEPGLTVLAKLIDGMDSNAPIKTTISEYIDASTVLNDLSGIFSEILSTVNRYHNHNVSVYKNVEDPEKIVEFSDDDFNFKFLEETDINAINEYMKTVPGATPLETTPDSENNTDTPVESTEDTVETTEVAEEDTKTKQ